MVDISVVIPAHNAAGTLRASLDSLLTVVGRGVQLVVVDDGSVDATAEIVKDFGGADVALVSQAQQGACAARNAGVVRADGRYVCFLDSDDHVSPAWGEFFLPIAQEGTIAFASGGVDVREPGHDERLALPRDLGPAYAGLVANLLPGAYVVRKDLFELAGGFETRTPYGEHHELGLRLAPLLRGQPTGRSDRVLVVKEHDRSTERQQRYAQAKLDSVAFMMDTHADLLRDDRGLRSDLSGVASLAASQLGHHRQAVRFAVSALRDRPRRLKNWGRPVARALAPIRRPPGR